MLDNPKDKSVNSLIAIVTSTLYPTWYEGRTQKKFKNSEQNKIDKIRGDLAIKMLITARKQGFQIVVVDSGSSPAFLEKLKQTGIKVTPAKNKSLSPSRQEGFQKAAKLKGVKVICWVEPEKVSFVKHALPQAVSPLLNNQADIVIPARDKKAFNTYPTYQAKIEKKANQIWNNILRKHQILPAKSADLDIWFGPKCFKNDPKLIGIFLKKYHFKEKVQKLDLWSGAIVLPIISALKQGYRVVSININYQHPRKQTAIEENSNLMKKKRQLQYHSILSTTNQFLSGS